MQNSKTSVTKQQTENHRRILQSLLKLDDNRRCADCQARGPTWASVNLGVFVCLNCSGIHRSLGTHMSKVRSTTLDTWLPEQVAFVELMGNRRANLFWEERLPKAFHRPAEGDMEGLKHFIGNKYRDRMYCSQAFGEAATIDNFGAHPFMAQFGPLPASAAGPAAPGAAAEGPSSTVAAALNSRSSAPAAVPAPVSAVKPAEPVAAPASSFDLLSMDDESPSAASAPATATSQRDSDGGWAAFESGMPSSAPAAAAAAAEDRWDAFPAAAPSRPAGAASLPRPPKPPQPAYLPSRGTQPPAAHSRSASAASAGELDLFSDPSLVIQPEYSQQQQQHARQRSQESVLSDPFASLHGGSSSRHAPHSSQDSQGDPFADFQDAQPVQPAGSSSSAAFAPPVPSRHSAPSLLSLPTAEASPSPGFAAFPEPAAPAVPAAKGAKHSASDILKMFDRPGQASFADFSQQSPPGFAAFGPQAPPAALPAMPFSNKAPVLAGLPAFGQPGLMTTTGFPQSNGRIF